MNNSKLSIKGNENKTAGRDYNEISNHYYPENDNPIAFYEEDIKEIILTFSNLIKLENKKTDEYQDFYRPKIEEKNRINSLREKYFKEIIVQKSMPYFNQIEEFLKMSENEEYSEFYENTVEELKNKIFVYRDNYDHFEEIFVKLYNFIFENNKIELKLNRKLIWIFLHYMYCNCDIGEKYDD